MVRKGSKSSSAKGKWYWNWISRNIYASVAAAFVVVLALLFMLKFITRHNQELEVPSFANLTLEQATALADAHNLRLEVTDSVYINRMVPGTVYKQNPLANSKVKKNRRILLCINATSPKLVKMPHLVGFSLRQALSELASSQLRVGKLIYVEDMATNNVVGQQYKGRDIEFGTEIVCESEIDLKVGVNPNEDMTYLPNLLGIPYPLVKNYLIDNSLNLDKAIFDATVKDFKDSLAAVVYRQIPDARDTTISQSVKMGSPVVVYCSLDKTLVPVTDPEDEEDQED
jgi:beta-lactam-binding protein with PASTA domain